MTTHEARHIAQIYGVTIAEVLAAERRASQEPMVPLGQVIVTVLNAVLTEEETR
jgi:hypothetical protein